MSRLKATVRNGHLVSDDTVDFPDGTEVEVDVVDGLAELDPHEREQLLSSLEESIAEADRGETIPHEEVLRRIRMAVERGAPMDFKSG